jgi:hypothetical protein
VSDLVFAAFQALGMGPSKREIALVAKAIRESEDEEALALFRAGSQPDPVFDRVACAAVTEIAERAGAGGLVALDLYTEVIRPGWSPFPALGAEERAAAADIEEGSPAKEASDE